MPGACRCSHNSHEVSALSLRRELGKNDDGAVSVLLSQLAHYRVLISLSPTALQLAKPVHHTFIDYIYWPELRDCLLLHPPAIGYERAILQSFGLLLCEIPGHNMSISILECFESIRNMQGHEGKRADELSEVEILQLQEALTVWNIFQMENWKLAPYFFEVYPEAREIGSLQSSFPFFTLA